MNPLISVLIKSVITTIIVSGICAFAASLLTTGFAIPVAVFIFASVLQFVLGYYLNIRKDYKSKEIDNILSQAIQVIQEQRLPYTLSCAYCNVQNNVPISFVNDNTFKCAGCNSPNKVIIQFSAVRITQPLEAKIENKDVPLDEDDIRETTVNQPITIAEAK